MPEFQNLLVVIGASAGGMKPLRVIVETLPASFEGTLIVATHRDPSLEANCLASILENVTRLQVRDPVQGESLVCQTLYVGPPSKALTVEGDIAHYHRVEEDVQRMERIDVLFEAAARFAGRNAVGVILSGMLWDGIEGLKAIAAAGGRCLVQSPMDAQFDSMPMNAISEVDLDLIGSAEEIAGKLISIAEDRSCR